MISIIGGQPADIPKDTPRKYPAQGKRPVRLSVQSYTGIALGATHWYVVIDEAANPFSPCHCEAEERTHEHTPWGDYGGHGDSRRLSFRRESTAYRALRRVERLINASDSHCAEIEEFDYERARELTRPSRYRSGD